MEYKTQVGIFETGEKDSQGGAYKDNRFLALRKRELNEYEVKEGVAIIGDRAFYDAKLRTVTLPNSLRAIGQSAFAGCKNLTDVALPEGLEVIKDASFRDCESLAELTLPSTLLEVGARAFGPGLKRLVILSENVTFSPDAFKQAKSLEEIHVPEAACAKYTVWFVALGLTAKITEIKEKNEIEESNTGNNNETLMENELYIEKLGDWFRESCIVETEDDVYYDADLATEEERELFVNNIKANYSDEEAEHIENLSFATADDFVKFLNDDEEDLSLPDTMVCAAFCAQQGIAIDDDTCICEDVQLYYFNDCREFHYEYETDIDLG